MNNKYRNNSKLIQLLYKIARDQNIEEEKIPGKINIFMDKIYKENHLKK